MRLTLAVVVLWTVLVGIVLLVTPTLTSAPACAGSVEVGPDCETLTAAGNQLVWVTQQRPIVLLAAGGYAVIAILGWGLRRRP